MKLEASQFSQDFKRVLLWLAKDYSEEFVANVLGNFYLYPEVLPTSEAAFEIYQSYLRTWLSNEKFSPAATFEIPKKIISRTANLSEALLVFLDGVQPLGIFDLEFGSRKLATCVCLEGRLEPSRLEKKVAKVEIDFGIGKKSKLELVADQIIRIPLGAGFTANLSLRVFPGFKILAGKKFSGKITGSELGLIFDTRGRPIVPPGETDNGILRLKAWKAALAY